MRVHRVAAWICSAFAFFVAPAPYAAPCAGFIDVQDTDPFCTHIAWMKNRGITLGCTANQYCPAQYVRRDQMAAFMYRLGFQNAFLQGGNAFGATATLGTTDNSPLRFKVNDTFVLGLTPATNTLLGSSPNLVGGHPNNKAAVICAGICIPTPEPLVGATVAGGGTDDFPNRVTDSLGFVGGGVNNRAGNDNADHFDAQSATVSGGAFNTASRQWSTVGGGASNIASGMGAVVPGGTLNEAVGHYSLAAGTKSKAHGDYSFAAGHRANAQANGCFAWADSRNFDFDCLSADEFAVRATGGLRLVTAVDASGVATAGVSLFPGDTSWNVISDRAAKANWRDVDGGEVLDKLASISIGEWSYRAQSDSIRHMGPSAQDFRAAFGLGHNDLTISTVDADGVALAAIQGLNRKLEQKIAALEAALQELAAELRALKDARRE